MRQDTRFIRTGLALLASTLVARYAAAAVFHVNDDAPADPGAGDCAISDPLEDGSPAHPFDSIQEALDAASSGDTILVTAGTYDGTCNVDLDFAGKGIQLKGAGCATCIIDGGGTNRAFVFDDAETSSATVKGFAIRNCSSITGGAVLCNPGSPTFDACCFQENTATSQGGALASLFPSVPTIVQCQFIENSAPTGGALYLLTTASSITESAFAGNEATNGGAIYLLSNADASIVNCDFNDNLATERGGGLYIDNGSDVVMTESEFLLNDAGMDGGAIFMDRASSLDAVACDWASNGSLLRGGALHLQDESSLGIADSSFTSNDAGAEGGALFADSDTGITIVNSVFDQNLAIGRGGALFRESGTVALVLHDTELTGNSSTNASGGAVAVVASPFEIAYCTIADNVAGVAGGGLLVDAATGTISDSVLKSNETHARGGGLFLVNSSVQVSATDFLVNAAVGAAAPRGGGLSSESSSLVVDACLFESNSADRGGGLEAQRGVVEVAFSVFRTNQAIDGAGAYHSGALGVRQASTYRWTRFVENLGSGSGGGQAFILADSRVHNCGYFGNLGMDGGAISADVGSVIDMAGSILSCNGVPAGGNGGALRVTQASLLRATNCTLHGNNAPAGNGGGIHLDVASNAAIENSILWENWDATGATFPAQLYITPGSGATASMAYSDMMNLPGCPGVGSNICLDPMFIDPDGADNICGTPDDDLRLALASPCIDAADNNLVPLDALDLDDDLNALELLPLDVVGSPRFADVVPIADTGLIHAAFAALPVVDMGALEFPWSAPPCPADLDGNGAVGPSDLALLLGAWGPCSVCTSCPADLDGDCAVGAADLAILLGSWGPC